MTSEPRRYGFHAALKAPFRLRVDLDVADLIGNVAEFAYKFTPFEAGDLEVGAIATGEGRALSRGLHGRRRKKRRALYSPARFSYAHELGQAR